MALLEIHNLDVQFGGLRALSDFSFSLDQGDLQGLIGPNGAGKTTAFNAVTGLYPPTAGDICLDNIRLEGLASWRINRLGIARTFQNIRLFSALSVLDNVMIGLNQSTTHGFWGSIFRTPRHQREERAHELEAREFLRALDLEHLARKTARSLPYGQQRRLEIARALATHPRILLLDEPAAGMNPQEKNELMQTIGMIRDRFGVGIWLIEHDMRLVMSICRRITVLDHGQTIAVGTPTEIQNDPRVIEAYLGEPV